MKRYFPFLVYCLVVAGCASVTQVANPPGTNPNTVAGIEASCKDASQTETWINGESYMCGPSAEVHDAIANLIQSVLQKARRPGI
jgi:uncharacterized protein YceK